MADCYFCLMLDNLVVSKWCCLIFINTHTHAQNAQMYIPFAIVIWLAYADNQYLVTECRYQRNPNSSNSIVNDKQKIWTFFLLAVYMLT